MSWATVPAPSGGAPIVAGGAVLFLALALLFRPAIAARFCRPELTALEAHATDRFELFARVAIVCLIAGADLLSVADTGWAHAIGIACLIGFVVVGFGAITTPATRTAGHSRVADP